MRLFVQDRTAVSERPAGVNRVAHRRTAIALLAVATPAWAIAGVSADAGADLFIGTLERKRSSIVLRRCDLVENRYTLIEAPGSHAMNKIRKAKLPAYGEVIAHYAEADGQPVLQVESVENLKQGKNCHLLDALDKRA